MQGLGGLLRLATVTLEALLSVEATALSGFGWLSSVSFGLGHDDLLSIALTRILDRKEIMSHLVSISKWQPRGEDAPVLRCPNPFIMNSFHGVLRENPHMCLLKFMFGKASILLRGTAYTAERTRPLRIGALTESWGPTPAIVALRDGLLELGYREHEQFVLGVRFTQGDLAALPAAARDLVQYEVDLIFAADVPAAKAAQLATTRIPIVFAGLGGNPVEMGLIQSFARPGGNITGVVNLDVDLGPKRLEVFRELVPGLRRILFPYDPTDASSVAAVQGYREAARRLGIVLVEQAVQTQAEAQATLAKVRKDEVDGILQPPPVAWNIPGFILETARQQGIPTMFDTAFYVEQSGGLASYGPDLYATGRQTARLVDKILKGTKPAEIPVETNAKIEFVINLKVAKALGLTIAPEILYQAHRLVR
jgi:putative ABC transport system substrate-binding protein